ncbi:Uncharacterised protein [Mycobacteroides abscessus subsp. abscessus]|nr:Uncharacterised protein [Mycobacteroides abscessus subsp. abscessus]
MTGSFGSFGAHRMTAESIVSECHIALSEREIHSTPGIFAQTLTATSAMS